MQRNTYIGRCGQGQRRPAAAAVLAASLWLAGTLAVVACSTPVFQYALENWPADPYQLTVKHHGLDEQAIEKDARAAFVPEDGPPANVQIRLSRDPGRPEGSGSVELRFPFHPKGVPPVLEKPYSKEVLHDIATSPVRQRLVQSLLGDATAAFLFLKSGNEERDRTARRRLKEILAELEANLELPFVPVEAGAEDEKPPTVHFPIIDVDAEDPAEAVLRKLLLATERDLVTFDEPMAFPVFGRGRALYAIVGRGINRDVLIEACLFITGACSCQVKAQNPGVDLLLSADWDKVFEELPYEEVELPPLAGVAPMAEAESEPQSPPVPLNEEPQAPERDVVEDRVTALTWAVAGALAVALLAVVGGTVAVFLRQGSAG